MSQPPDVAQTRRGAALVFASAAVWSFGGTIARYLSVTDSWTIVFWRSLFATAFLLGFMLWRHGPGGTRQLFKAMGLAGMGVGLCFAVASTAFVVALAHTTVANVLLIQAAVPLLAALMAYVLLGERIALATWLAIAAVIVGVAIMVSASMGGRISPVGDALALLVAIAFAGATVITRTHSKIAMLPAVCTGTTIAACVALTMASNLSVSAGDAGLLFLFGALNLGLGMVFFVTGARLVPATLAALIGVSEPVLGPLWVWLVHQEVPGHRTLIGGAVVFVALLAHLIWQARLQRRSTHPA